MLVSRPLLALLLCLGACDSSSSKSPSTEPQTPPSADGLPANGPGPLPPAADPVPQIETPAALLPRELSTTPQAMLQSLGAQLVQRSQNFDAAVARLETAGRNFCAQSTPEAQASAQAAWQDVMQQWQYFEIFQVGPLAANAKTLKYSIYAWPDPANYCKIDEEAIQQLADPSQALPPNYNRKGLQAVEYLLFEPTLESRCVATNPVAATWNAQSPELKQQARCAYLQPLLSDLRTHSTALLTGWGSVDNNPLYSASGSLPLDQYQTLFDNLFYLDLELKNRKISAPAGHDLKDCPTAPQPCLDRKEFNFASFSREAIGANVEAFTTMMFGPAGSTGGFTALIRNAGRDDIADRSEELAAKLALLNESGKDKTLDQLVTEQAAEDCSVSSQSWLCQMRVQIKAMASELKNEYAQVLQLKLPEAPQGDND